MVIALRAQGVRVGGGGGSFDDDEEDEEEEARIGRFR